MIVENNKIALNPYTTDVSKRNFVGMGDSMIAYYGGIDCNLTKGKQYTLVGIRIDSDCCLLVENDMGKRQWYGVDYFRQS